MASAKLISGGDLHLLPIYDPHPSSSHLSFTRNITSKPIRPRRHFSIRTTHSSARSATFNAFYVPTKTAESFYDLLGISENGTLSEIKKAYKQLARRYHPDVSPPERTEEFTKKFIMVQEAYETLSDPQTRAVYDLDLARGLHLAFRRSSSGERVEEEWKGRWQSQLNELKRRAVNKDLGGKTTTWGSRMRRRRNSNFDMGL